MSLVTTYDYFQAHGLLNVKTEETRARWEVRNTVIIVVVRFRSGGTLTPTIQRLVAIFCVTYIPSIG